MTSVRMAVARLIHQNSELAMGEGISNREIMEADWSHPMSGLQRLRELAKEFRLTHGGWVAYGYRSNRYIFSKAFIRWVTKLCRQEVDRQRSIDRKAA